MKTSSALLTLGALATLSFVSCASIWDDTPATTTDARYLSGTLESFEASLDTAAASEDLTSLFTSDSTSVLIARSADRTDPVDNGDGTMTITRTGKHWAGFTFTKVLVRSKKPTLVELPADGNTVEKTAEENWYIGTDTTTEPFATIAITTTWTNVAGTIEITALTRSGERLGLGKEKPQVLTIAASYEGGELVSKTVEHYSTSVDAANLLYTETFEKFAATTTEREYTKISRFDALGALKGYRTIATEGTAGALKQTIVRYVAREDLGELKRELTIRTETDDGWSMSHVYYRADGTEKSTNSETVVSTQVGESTTIERKVIVDGVSLTVLMTITPTAEGYDLAVTNSEGATVNYTATRTADGAWIISNQADTAADPETVAGEDAV